MTNWLTDTEIEQQRSKVFAENPAIELVAPCKIGEGILKLTDEEKAFYSSSFTNRNAPISFFIPASGSGSRMFQFLYEFLEGPTEENRGQVEHFLNSISDFAFFKQIPADLQKAIVEQRMELEEIVSYLLNDHGLGFGKLPKGMIPFHRKAPFILNPFQEHIIQGTELGSAGSSFHFTIQTDFEESIRDGIDHVKGLTGEKIKVEFSEQSVSSNSVAFNSDGTIVKDEKGRALTRPAGHGALLSNLNALNEELIFIKNIDNVQHFDKSAESEKTWKIIGGLLIEFKKLSKEVYENPTMEGLNKLNNLFQVYSLSEIEDCKDADSIRRLVNRPSRVCGMVKNEGQPGGGPFWVNEKGIVSKQIVEKAQISLKGDQYKLMVQSTHFNPVMIAASPRSLDGKKFDLNDYKDDSKYFIVNKTQNGQQIRYLELPGLWNGSMANWNAIFVEVPSSTFSPVKTVLDLLGEPHKP
jgi:hypothetical protein